MSHGHGSPLGSRAWLADDGPHLDVRGLPGTEPVATVLRTLDSGASATLVVHLDDEPMQLYPELDDRGWAYEVLRDGCGEPGCEHELQLRVTRLLP